MNVLTIRAVAAVATMSIGLDSSIAAEPFTIYISGQVASYEVDFSDFRSAGVITWGSSVKIACVARPWPSAVNVKWTFENGQKGEKAVQVPELPRPGSSEERYLFVVFSHDGFVAVRGINRPLKPGLGKCPEKDEFPWLRNQ